MKSTIFYTVCFRTEEAENMETYQSRNRSKYRSWPGLHLQLLLKGQFSQLAGLRVSTKYGNKRKRIKFRIGHSTISPSKLN